MAGTRQFVMLLFWLIHFSFFTDAAVNCPGDYVPSEESSSCVNVFVNLGRGYSWDEARDECRLDGGDLVKIVNQAMNDFLYDLAMSESDFSKQRIPCTWIGLNDPNSDNTWVWLDEEDQAAWTNWNYLQPDDTSQDCVALDAMYLGEWRDLECIYSSYWSGESYICEIPALTTTIATTTTTKTTRTTSMAETTPEISTTATTASSGAIFTTTSLFYVTSDSSLGGLSVAAIAGIVTGVLVVAALVPAAFLTIRYFRNRQRTGHSHTKDSVAYANGLDDREAIVTVG